MLKKTLEIIAKQAIDKLPSIKLPIEANFIAQKYQTLKLGKCPKRKVVPRAATAGSNKSR